MNAVAPGLGADIDHGISRARRFGIKDLIAPHQPQRKRIHQRIARVTALELHLTADVGHAKAVAVRRHAADHAFHHGVILISVSWSIPDAVQT